MSSSFIHFQSVDLYLDDPAQHEELYNDLTPYIDGRSAMDTRILWAKTKRGEARCLKEFSLADTRRYFREIPDPGWHKSPTSEQSQKTQNRGLQFERAESFQKLLSGELQKEIIQCGPYQNMNFRCQFNAYSFELEALIMQFALHYGCQRLVTSYRWGPLYFKENDGPRNTIEMERLESLAPPAPRDLLHITHRLIEMMSATTQLHSMLIPLRCYPPELTKDLEAARKQQIARPFHYDLSPDQFMQRPDHFGSNPQVILIDFNASRVDQTDYSDFSWRTIPGKDYYQPLERRSQQELQEDLTHRSSPMYDLYALLMIGLFYLRRTTESQRHIRDIKGWGKLDYFYKYLHAPKFASRLCHIIPSNKGIHPEPLAELMAIVFQKDPVKRKQELRRFLGFTQNPLLREWMMVPVAMNFIAEKVMGRTFRIAWRQNHIQQMEAKETEIPLSTYVDLQHSEWLEGKWEHGRISHPTFTADQLFFFQAENQLPIVRKGLLIPAHPGKYTVFASFGGCVDLENPLHIEVLASQRNQQAKGFTQELSSAPPTPVHTQPIRLADLSQESSHSNAPTLSTPLPPSEAISSEHISAAPTTQEQLPPAQPAAFAASGSSTQHFSRSDAYDQVPSSPPSEQYSSQQPSGESIAPTTGSVFSTTSSNTYLEEKRSQEMYYDLIAQARATGSLQELKGLKSMVKEQHGESPQGLSLLLLVNILSRQCELKLAEGTLYPESPELLELAMLKHPLQFADYTLGLLLNNLSICCHMSALEHNFMPNWMRLFEFAPEQELQKWCRRTNPGVKNPATERLARLRARAYETIRYCKKISAQLGEQEAAL